jgi:hypothetical protein
MAETLWCPKCGAEYRPGFILCADCHVSLVDQLPPRVDQSPPRPFGRMIELVRVLPLEANVIVAELRASGVRTATTGADPAYGSFSFAEGVPVYVAEEDLVAAREVLSENPPNEGAPN